MSEGRILALVVLLVASAGVAHITGNLIFAPATMNAHAVYDYDAVAVIAWLAYFGWR